MASQSSGDVEILVHVAAPSRVADDAAYRRLAQAYLSFAPGSRALVTIPSSPEIQQPPPSRQCQQYDEEEFGFAVLQSFCSDSQELSFKEALDNRFSPRLVTAKTRLATPPPPSQVLPDDHVTMPTAAVSQLPSQISDSYPMPDCDMFNVTPTRVLQRYMGSRQPTPTPTAPPPVSSPTLSSIGDGNEADNLKVGVPTIDIGISSSIPLSNLRSSQDNREQRHATIPVTPLIPEASRKRKSLDNEDVHDTSALDATHISSSIPGSSDPSVAALSRAETDPLPSKRLRQLAGDTGTVHLVRSASDNTNQPNPHQHARLSSSPLSYDILSQIPSPHLSSSSSFSSLSVRPASPPVGVGRLDLTSLVSAKLGKLATDLGSRYRPTIHRSALAPLERGHWRVDCRRWPSAQRADAWAFLVGYVRSGLAGWGVWCRRSADGRTIKLYGWAHVAKHTYLLLYLASGRHIKATGAQWIDADGAVAIEVMPLVASR